MFQENNVILEVLTRTKQKRKAAMLVFNFSFHFAYRYVYVLIRMLPTHKQFGFIYCYFFLLHRRKTMKTNFSLAFPKPNFVFLKKFNYCLKDLVHSKHKINLQWSGTVPVLTTEGQC